ncbi:MAG TPA: hypothetical protein DDW21_00710, partial [Verrucomicrobiales bacterium]|nr:hypothetical protein [Verrucomicrobiales bacterium]
MGILAFLDFPYGITIFRNHRKEEEPLTENIKIITLPAYSPELNPVEKLWDIVKD